MLAGQATATPKTADGAVEMMRQLKVARDSAVKARTTAMSTLKQILVNAPPVLREPLQGPHRSRARHPLCGTATGSTRHTRRIRETHAPVTGPSLAHPRRRNHDA